MQGCFAKFTLSPFAALRAVRSGMANGLSMTRLGFSATCWSRAEALKRQI